MTNTDHKKAMRVDELDGLRGLLALWVAITHILCWCGFATLSFWVPGPANRLWGQFIFAGPAVDTFIILSGFAISSLIHSRDWSYGRFMTGRFFRIYPVYLLCLGLGLLTIAQVPFVLETAGWRETIYFEWSRVRSHEELTRTGEHLLGHLTLLFGILPKSVLPESTSTLLAPAWSISLEWQYYLAAPFIARIVCRRTGVFVLALVACAGVYWSRHWQNPHVAFLPALLPLFLVGIGSYHLYARWGRGKARVDASFLVVLVLAAAIMSSWHWVALCIWALVFGSLFVAGDDFFSRALGRIRRALLHPWLQWLGRISYPLYLVHWPLILFLLIALLRWNPGIGSGPAVLLMLAVGLPLILLSAWLLHKWVEAPLMRFGKKFTDSSTGGRLRVASPEIERAPAAGSINQ